MQSWQLDRLRLQANEPQILESGEDGSRVVALLLPGGEVLQEHLLHEYALVFIIRGLLLVGTGASERRLSSSTLIRFEAGEHSEACAITECQLILCSFPASGPEQQSQRTATVGRCSLGAESPGVRRL
jgi:hypothetical protein